MSGHRWWVTALSALLGGASHVILDLDGGVNDGTDNLLGAVGAAATAIALVHIGRRRLIARWHGPAPAVRRRPVLFWTIAAALCVAGFTVVPVLPAAHLHHTTGARLIAVVAIALLAAAASVGYARRPAG